MIVTFDLNVVVDVFERRQPFFEVSREALNWASSNKIKEIFPLHCVATMHYLVSKHMGLSAAERALDFVLTHLDVYALNNQGLQQARALRPMEFEDAIVATTALQSGLTLLVTRNVADFRGSQVPAISPVAFLEKLATT